MPVVDGVFVVPDGMPSGVWRDKYARRKEDGTFQSWVERGDEVVDGNLALRPGADADDPDGEFRRLVRKGVVPMSGRHLQHGDIDQPTKMAELFMNCTTAMFSWAGFLLLMKGCGVGRDYSSDVCFVDWDYLPICRFVLEGPGKDGAGGHPDYESWIETVDEARHKYGTEGERVRWHEVEDSAEGWARVVMIMETAAFHKNNADVVFVFDFSKVRRAGSPLRGQQGRPASGPVPLIKALTQVMTIKGAGMKPWKQAAFVDHYLAVSVVAGGVRRAARAAIKSHADGDMIEFVDLKRGGYLWSANNSGATDAAFWAKAREQKPSRERRVFEAMVGCAYWDGTGEPGFFNVDTVNDSRRALDDIRPETYLSANFRARMGGIHERTDEMTAYHLGKAKARRYIYIPNPCFEIPLAVWGGYCDVGDVGLCNADGPEEVLVAGRRLAEALVRVNTMDAIYGAEVRRTNRIGVSLTGIHEYMWRAHGLDFRRAIDRSDVEAARFWDFVTELRIEVERAADAESDRCGLPHPVTYTCIKPSGTVSKVLACTEGAHLPAHRRYVRWVALQSSDPKVRGYAEAGYPVRDIGHRYPGTSIVGFPTCLPIVEEIPADLLVTASEATPGEQFRWLRLLEDHWLGPDRRNGQVSYTLKWSKAEVSYEEYMRLVLENQPTVRCCAMMPDLEQDASAYAYLPEEPVSEEVYNAIVAGIRDRSEVESYDEGALACESGACPIEENIN